MLYTEFIAGWISGALGLVVGHPVDTVKVRIQTQSRYHGIVDCIVKTYQKEKVYFTAPVDLIKVRLQNQTDTLQSHKTGSNIQAKYRGPVYCAASIFREEGITGLYRGSTALVLRDVPTVGIYFLTYEVLSKWMTSNGEMPSSWTMLFAGGCAGTVGWAAANPMDVIKSRLQMDGMYKVQYRGMYDCIQKSIKQEGLRVLLKGLTVNSLRAFPVNAVTFLSYEKLLQIL
ncbi:PREDICTED: solute carrier family 25 member 45 isoform X3 [Nanorana parkeri]|uniref:solute carrier family 25 member 45 isoform X3 n=1 Tax=Nanorana parkeri TaxID=125878 RepID=UPI0008546D23|nr:PREDICTED: solute carrier family 25 member 45 isoform X3 [Nanorana parkeri]